MYTRLDVDEESKNTGYKHNTEVINVEGRYSRYSALEPRPLSFNVVMFSPVELDKSGELNPGKLKIGTIVGYDL